MMSYAYIRRIEDARWGFLLGGYHEKWMRNIRSYLGNSMNFYSGSGQLLDRSALCVLLALAPSSVQSDGIKQVPLLWIPWIVQNCFQFWKWTVRMFQGQCQPDLMHPENALGSILKQSTGSSKTHVESTFWRMWMVKSGQIRPNRKYSVNVQNSVNLIVFAVDRFVVSPLVFSCILLSGAATISVKMYTYSIYFCIYYLQHVWRNSNNSMTTNCLRLMGHGNGHDGHVMHIHL